MRVFLGDSPYETSLSHCCGVFELGNFRANDQLSSWETKEHYPKIEKIESRGCGIFVSTFLPSQQKAMDECEKHHTLLFKTGPHKNEGDDASTEGRNKGVYLCVFKFGKAK